MFLVRGHSQEMCVPYVRGRQSTLVDAVERDNILPSQRHFSGMLRYHLGLVVPHENPQTIRIKDLIYTWKEGAIAGNARF